jgi:hypothetical protein
MTACRLCKQPTGGDWLDFGAQAITNRFLRSADEPEYTHPLTFGVCQRCGTVQLGAVPPADEVRPHFDWIFYNEPESHLDDYASVIAKLPGLTAHSTLCGISYKDESTLRRLRDLGLPNSWIANLKDDLGIESPRAGIESIQQVMNETTARRLVRKHGRPDVVLFRHVLEHSHDLLATLAGLRELVAPGGYLVFEMPDATRALERLDYSTVWEEHLFYFTPYTLRRCFEMTGFEVVFLHSYFYTLENSLVAIVRPKIGASAASPAKAADLEPELARAQRFVRSFADIRARQQAYFSGRLGTEGKAALLGAGHLSGAYINLLGLEPYIDFVVDDNANKQGLFMPGSRVPILPSSALVTRNVRLCLMTVRPEIEDAVANKNQAFTARGGRLASIFPDSPYALKAA